MFVAVFYYILAIYRAKALLILIYFGMVFVKFAKYIFKIYYNSHRAVQLICFYYLGIIKFTIYQIHQVETLDFNNARM